MGWSRLADISLNLSVISFKNVTGGFDPDTIYMDDLMTLGFMMLDILLTDEVTQINGIQVLLDFTDFRMAHAWAVDKAHVDRTSKCMQVQLIEGVMCCMCSWY